MFKQLGCFTVLCLSGLVAGLALYWQQTTRLPSWYETDHPPASSNTLTQTQLQDPTELQRLQTQLHTHVETALSDQPPSISDPAIEPQNSDGSEEAAAVAQVAPPTLQATPSRQTVQLNAAEFNAYLATILAEKQGRQPLIGAIKAIHTEIQGGKVTSGIVVDFSAVPVEQLPPPHQSVMQNLRYLLPLVGDRDIYLGIEGQPLLKQGRLHWNNRVQINVGGVKFNGSQVAEQLDLPTAKLERPLQLTLGHLQVHDITFQGEQAIITGSVQP